MNTVWSSYVQGVETLYYSRRLRFDDMFCERFKPLFMIKECRPTNILEIGCGPGALAGALQRWYADARITAVDRDSAFIEFASKHEKGVSFMEADATALPFPDSTFDVTVSNTVSEHIEPSAFFGEQLRVLKPGGICLVLSSRRGINIAAECLKQSDFERSFWEKASKYDDSMEKYAVCKYPMSEAELPLAMEKHGFSDITVGYATVDLTPDDPKYPREMAHAMINSGRFTSLNAIDSVLHTAPDRFTHEEIDEMKRLINKKYDKRIEQYERGEKQWDTNVNIIMVVRGVKKHL